MFDHCNTLVLLQQVQMMTELYYCQCWICR